MRCYNSFIAHLADTKLSLQTVNICLSCCCAAVSSSTTRHTASVHFYSSCNSHCRNMISTGILRLLATRCCCHTNAAAAINNDEPADNAATLVPCTGLDGGVYRPPKLNPVAMDEDRALSRKEERKLREAQRKAQRRCGDGLLRIWEPLNTCRHAALLMIADRLSSAQQSLAIPGNSSVHRDFWGLKVLWCIKNCSVKYMILLVSFVLQFCHA